MICEDCHEPIKGASTGICSSCTEFPGWRREFVVIRMLGPPAVTTALCRQRHSARRAEHARLAAEQRQRTASEFHGGRRVIGR